MDKSADMSVTMVGRVSPNESRAYMIWKLEPPKLTMRFDVVLYWRTWSRWRSLKCQFFRVSLELRKFKDTFFSFFSIWCLHSKISDRWRGVNIESFSYQNAFYLIFFFIVGLCWFVLVFSSFCWFFLVFVGFS
jgi:hypothetical protein